MSVRCPNASAPYPAGSGTVSPSAGHLTQVGEVLEVCAHPDDESWCGAQSATWA